MAESILSFFAKIIENFPQLILLFLGTVLFIISSAEHLPIVGLELPLSGIVRIGLFFIGLLLIGFSLWMLYGNEKLRRSSSIDEFEKEKQRLTSKIDALEVSVNSKDVKVRELETLIGAAIEVAQGKGITEIARILSNANQILDDAGEKIKPLIDAANWVKLKTDKWVKAIEPYEYKEYGIGNSNIKEFRGEIAEHLVLLERNLREMIPDTIPRLCKTPQAVATNRLAYEKALKSILVRMETDLEKDEVLDNTAREQLLMYTKTLIKKTTA
jgi:hypothetical protein